jgi:hypothetical protein
VRIQDQYQEIIEVNNLTNMTQVYADLWDGTNSVPLTANSVDLSGAPVGTFFTKNRDSAEPYSVSISDQCRVNEVTSDAIRESFEITQKCGANTFIRLNYTTNTILDFWLYVCFVYEAINGGKLTLVA